MKIKFIAIDLDGTLLKDNRISTGNEEAIKMAIERGAQVAIVTGRVYTSPRFYMEQMGIRLPTIAGNGAVIVAPDGKVRVVRPMPEEKAREILKVCDEKDLAYHFYDQDTYYAKTYTSVLLEHLKAGEDEAAGFQTSLNISRSCMERAIQRGQGITKIVVDVLDRSKIPEVRRIFQDLKGVEMVQSGSRSLEFMAVGVNKYSGLELYLDSIGISMDTLCAIGDYENDLPMIKNAAFGVAMGNAIEPVKEAAQFITKTNEEDGVAFAIHEMINRGYL
ncbi:MAG: Cof-type HAD-IIB family hydrolase [Tissierellia bacterium]|nr:Cof-type HAD-IIB family hydrolase [Tissierellia bacterium]